MEHDPLTPNLGPQPAPVAPPRSPGPAAVASTPPPTAPPPRNPSLIERILPLLIAVIAIATGVGIFIFMQRYLKKPETPTPITIIVTPTPSPTPVRYPTNLSTTSAFLTFVDDVASLAAQVREFEKDDPSLSPPVLVLPLGYPQ